jgi:hypothetical protein
LLVFVHSMVASLASKPHVQAAAFSVTPVVPAQVAFSLHLAADDVTSFDLSTSQYSPVAHKTTVVSQCDSEALEQLQEASVSAEPSVELQAARLLHLLSFVSPLLVSQ